MAAAGHKPEPLLTRLVSLPVEGKEEEGGWRAEVVARAWVDPPARGLPPAGPVLDAWPTGVRVGPRPGRPAPREFEGRAGAVVAYRGPGPDRPLVLVPVEIPFAGRLGPEGPGAAGTGSTAGAVPGEQELEALVEAVEARPVPAGPGWPRGARCGLEVFALLRVGARRGATGSVTVLGGISGPSGLRVRSGEITALGWLRPGRTTVEVRGHQDLRARGRPPCRGVVGCWGHALITDARPQRGRLGFSGRAEVRVVYSGPGRPLCVVPVGLPFSGVLDVDGARPGGPVELSCALEEARAEARDRDGDGEGESLAVTASVAVTARALQQVTLPAVLEVTGLPGLEARRQLVPSWGVVGRGEVRAVARAVLEPEGRGGPRARTVLWCRAVPSLQGLELMEGRLALLGRVGFSALFEDEAGGAGVARGAAGCEAVLVMPGAGPGARPQATMELEGVEWRLEPSRPAGPGLLEATAVVRFRALVVAAREVEVVTGVRVTQAASR